MKRLLLSFLASTLISFSALAQGTDGVLIDPNNATTRDASAVFQAQSTSQGVLVPRMTAAQRGAITVDATRNGLMVYQADAPAGFYYYTGAAWVMIANSSGNLADLTNSTGIAAFTYDGSAAATIAFDYTSTLSSTLAANNAVFGTTGIIFEGTTPNASQGLLTPADPSADRTWTLPDASGTIALTSQIPTGAALTKVDDTNVTLTLGGSPATSLINAASVTAGWTGQLSVPRGGTGAATFTTNGVLYGNTAGALQVTAQGAAGTVLHGNGGVPTFSPIVSADITDGTITSADIADGTIVSADIADGTIVSADVFDGTIVSSDIADGTVTGTDILDGSVGTADVAGLDVGDITTGVLPIARGGTNSGTALTASAIMTSNGSAIVQGPLGTTTTVLHGNAAGAPTYGPIVSADITDGTIATVDIAANAVTVAKLPSGASGTTFLRGDGTWVVPTNSGGTVTSVSGSGGTTGLTLTGGPITSSGTLTLGGTLAVANGGTGSTTQNWVDLTTAQTAAGIKTWSNNAIFNANVGIGSATPAYKLDVVGDTKTSGKFFGHLNVDDTRAANTAPTGYNNEVAFDFKQISVLNSAPGSGTYGGLITMAPWGDNSGDASHQLLFNEGGIYWRQGQPDAAAWDAWSQVLTTSAGGAGTANYLARWITPNSLGIGATYDNGTNVGIGTTTPGYKFDVNGGIRAIDYGGAGTVNVMVGDDTYLTDVDQAHTMALYSTSNNAVGQLQLGSNTATYLYGASGNIGIGNTGPAEKLDVTGNIKATGVVYWGNGLVRTETRDNAGLRGDAGARSGFFETSTPTNYYSGASSFQHLIDVRHSNNGNNYAMQLAGSFFDQKLYFRKTNDNAATAWSEVALGGANGPNSAWSLSGTLVSSRDDLGTTNFNANNDDDISYTRNLGFSVTIDGTSYSQVSVSTNGLIVFGGTGATACCSQTWPLTISSAPMVAFYYHDMKDYGLGEFMRDYTVGTAPGRTWILRYVMREYSGTVSTLECMVMIHETSGLINVKYFGANPTLNGQANVVSNTVIGFQGAGGASAKYYPITYNGKIMDDNAQTDSWSISPVR